jgi:hypothetical protein
MERVLPVVAALAGRHPERTVFTRFIPPERATDMPGMWQRYYQKWKEATREHLDPTLLELLPSLAELCPPPIVVDKTRAIRGEAGPSRDGTQRWQAATNQLPKNVYKPPGISKVVDGDGTKQRW